MSEFMSFLFGVGLTALWFNFQRTEEAIERANKALEALKERLRGPI